jgi:hypothetical protein
MAVGESKPEAYPQVYVEDFDESRTPLAGFFRLLLRPRLGYRSPSTDMIPAKL